MDPAVILKEKVTLFGVRETVVGLLNPHHRPIWAPLVLNHFFLSLHQPQQDILVLLHILSRSRPNLLTFPGCSFELRSCFIPAEAEHSWVESSA